jgi:hypothetical protein
MEVYDMGEYLLAKEHPIEANTERIDISFITIFLIL